MTEQDRRRRVQAAYEEAAAQLMEILYEQDPDGVGATVSAPVDEYGEEAARLMVALRGAETEADVRQVLTARFDGVSDRLVAQIHESWMEFRSKA